MSEPLTKHQIFEYRREEPFIVLKARNSNDSDKSMKQLLNHWHEELEIAYVLAGASRHHIDGKCITAQPGRVVVVNCECVHNIIVDKVPENEDLRCIILLISKKFVEENFPEYRTMAFTNEQEQAPLELKEAILRLSRYSEQTPHRKYDYLHARGLLLEVLYYLCIQGIRSREEISGINYQKNIERIRGVLQYVENHYSERIVQAEIAEKFYFSKEYFSRFFHKCCGVTFTEHLTRYRLQKARLKLLETNSSILEIAMDNGFCDGKSFINAFKKEYSMTPLQYRKQMNMKDVS